jgi:hypothetical protein
MSEEELLQWYNACSRVRKKEKQLLDAETNKAKGKK